MDYLPILIKSGVIVGLAILLKITLSIYLSHALKKSQKRVKQTRLRLLNHLASATIYLFAIIFILFQIPGFKEISYSLLAGAGILAIVIGFAAQKTLSNVIAGISIALYTPMAVGDKLKIFDEYGEVEDLNLRHVIVKTWDNRRLVIPNSIIDSKEIINFSLEGEEVLWTLNMGISYDSNIDKARKIMIDKAKKNENIIQDKDIFVRVTECKDFAVNLRLYFWCKDAWIAWKTSHELTESIKKEFDKKGIEIPFPYRTIVYKKDIKKK
ncbi:MAG: mechanosensitive ion channel family protein [Candidatus Nanoarchaeia archaeon]